MAEKIAASKTEMNVKNAEKVASLARAEKVLGSEKKKQMIAPITANTTVHWLCPVMVFKYSEVTSTWRAFL